VATVAGSIDRSPSKDITRGQEVAQDALLVRKGDDCCPDCPRALIPRDVEGGLAMTVRGREIRSIKKQFGWEEERYRRRMRTRERERTDLWREHHSARSSEEGDSLFDLGC
jgi:hypothetical protein